MKNRMTTAVVALCMLSLTACATMFGGAVEAGTGGAIGAGTEGHTSGGNRDDGLNMEVTEVRIRLANDMVKAYASICLDDCFLVHDIKVIKGPTRSFYLIS